MSENDITMKKNTLVITCPHCNYKFKIHEHKYFIDQNIELEHELETCPKCKKVFQWTCNIEITYTSSAVDWVIAWQKYNEKVLFERTYKRIYNSNGYYREVF